jgi:hypothetical protein
VVKNLGRGKDKGTVLQGSRNSKHNKKCGSAGPDHHIAHKNFAKNDASLRLTPISFIIFFYLSSFNILLIFLVNCRGEKGFWIKLTSSPTIP